MDTREMLAKVAKLLNALPYRAIYVGGATTHLLISDPTAPEATPTKDVDLLVDVDSPVTFQVHLGECLRTLGAREDTSEGAPLCRWKLEGVTVDVMSPNSEILGFSNSWYRSAIDRAQKRDLGGVVIEVIDAATFLATKVEAFLGRGKGDFLASKDVDDIIAVIDGRPEIVDEVLQHGERLRVFLGHHFARWIERKDFLYAVEGYLGSDVERMPSIFERIRSIIGSAPGQSET